MILNLADQSNSEIEYEIIRFPDGQQDIRIKTIFSHEYLMTTVLIQSRLNSFLDLELILCVDAALKNLGIWDIELEVPYFLGGRSDRLFMQGGTSYLKDVICPIINEREFSKVIVYDPHSNVLSALLNNVEIRKVNLLSHCRGGERLNEIILVGPDTGAQKRVDEAAKYKIVDTIICSKKRDMASGKILSTIVPESKNNLPHVLVDDICDGGRTFIEIAKVLRSRGVYNIYLCVTHGIFSKGLEELRTYFNRIYTTNSVKDIDDPLVVQTNLF